MSAGPRLNERRLPQSLGAMAGSSSANHLPRGVGCVDERATSDRLDRAGFVAILRTCAGKWCQRHFARVPAPCLKRRTPSASPNSDKPDERVLILGHSENLRNREEIMRSQMMLLIAFVGGCRTLRVLHSVGQPMSPLANALGLDAVDVDLSARMCRRAPVLDLAL